MKGFHRIKGAEDFYPAMLWQREQVFSAMRAAALNHGFLEVDVPAIESFSLLAAKQGEEIRSQIFTIEKKGEEELAMRAEFTPGFARMFIEKQRELPKPVKWFSIGKVWRYERPQAGRHREFFQFNAEVYGSGKPEADAEVINLLISSLLGLGLMQNDFFVRVNNRKLLQGLLLEKIDKGNLERTLRAIDKRHKVSRNELLKELAFLGKSSQEIVELLDLTFEDLGRLQLKGLAKEGYDELKQCMRLVRPGFARFDLSIARGLAYYTGTVFEAYDSEMRFRALAGGGRYDSLISMYGGADTPATGFAMGYATISLLLARKKLEKEPELSPDIYVAVQDGAVCEQAFSLVARLRQYKKVETDITGRNLSNQLKHANRLKAKKLIVFGKEEAESGLLKIKDMLTGEEKLVQEKDIIQAI